jgi:hypothetical protein
MAVVSVWGVPALFLMMTLFDPESSLVRRVVALRNCVFLAFLVYFG